MRFVAGRGAAAKSHREDAAGRGAVAELLVGRGAAAKSYREDVAGRGAVAEILLPGRAIGKKMLAGGAVAELRGH